MLEKDEPTLAEPSAAIPELLEDRQEKRGRLVAQTRELERLREQVRGTAEREAAAIVTAARSNVRQVLLDARRELLVLVAQLQAVGCETPAVDASNRIVATQTATASEPVREPEPPTSIPYEPQNSAIIDARREVREVLLEAQSELLALSEEARELRARIARRLDAEHEFPLEQALPAQTATKTIDPVADFEPAEQIEAPAADDVPLEPMTAAGVESEPATYAPLASPSRAWIAVAAAITFAVVGASLVFFAGEKPSAAPSAPVALKTKPDAGPQAASAAAAASATSGVTLSMQVRRPVWIRATIDGRADSGRVFNVGETRTITASRDVVLRAGDAGAVLVAVNGAKASPLGGDGEVANRRFSAPAPAPGTRPQTLQAAATQAPRTPAAGSPSPSNVGTTGNRAISTAPGPAARSAGNALVSPAATPGSEVEREILRATQRWFEAYFEGDRSQMAEIATADFALQDQRSDGQRLPPTQPGVERRMQQVRIELAGDGAVMSGRLTERVAADGSTREYVSLVSSVWIRRDGRWLLMGVRLVDSANVAPQP